MSLSYQRLTNCNVRKLFALFIILIARYSPLKMSELTSYLKIIILRVTIPTFQVQNGTPTIFFNKRWKTASSHYFHESINNAITHGLRIQRILCYNLQHYTGPPYTIVYSTADWNPVYMWALVLVLVLSFIVYQSTTIRTSRQSRRFIAILLSMHRRR